MHCFKVALEKIMMLIMFILALHVHALMGRTPNEKRSAAQRHV